MDVEILLGGISAGQGIILASLCPHHTVFPSYCNLHLYLVKITVHPTLTNVFVETKDMCVSCGHIHAFS